MIPVWQEFDFFGLAPKPDIFLRSTTDRLVLIQLQVKMIPDIFKMPIFFN